MEKQGARSQTLEQLTVQRQLLRHSLGWPLWRDGSGCDAAVDSRAVRNRVLLLVLLSGLVLSPVRRLFSPVFTVL